MLSLMQTEFMKHSIKHMAKQQQSKRIRIILLVAGFLFVCGGFYLFVNGLI